MLWDKSLADGFDRVHQGRDGDAGAGGSGGQAGAAAAGAVPVVRQCKLARIETRLESGYMQQLRLEKR
jgi:urocanate hydratase